MEVGVVLHTVHCNLWNQKYNASICSILFYPLAPDLTDVISVLNSVSRAFLDVRI